MKNVAVVMGGCGRADGTEIHEAVSCLIHLSRHGLSYRCFAPDRDQTDVINHITNQPMPEQRNLMIEAARISRGEMSPLASLDPAQFDAVVFPGGFGAAKNLSTFAVQGADCSVDADVSRVIKAFHAARKPVGVCCIAPVLAARVLGRSAGGPGVEVTIGNDQSTAGAIGRWGSKNVVKKVEQSHTDFSQRIASTPAYMYAEATPAQIFEGIGLMIDNLVHLEDAPGAAR